MTRRRTSEVRRKTGGDDGEDDGTSGDASLTLEAIVGAHAEFVWRSLRRAGVPEAMVDDAAQQVFLVVAGKLGVVRAGRERAFLYGTVLNVAAHARRRVARRREVDDEAYADLLDDAPLQDETLDAARTAALVERVLAGLPRELREVLVEVELEERTLPEVAERLAIPVGTVASRLRRAREEMALEVGRLRPSRRLRAASRRKS